MLSRIGSLELCNGNWNAPWGVNLARPSFMLSQPLMSTRRREIFQKILRAAEGTLREPGRSSAALGRPHVIRMPGAPPAFVPHLTEDWFC